MRKVKRTLAELLKEIIAQNRGSIKALDRDESFLLEKAREAKEPVTDKPPEITISSLAPGPVGYATTAHTLAKRGRFDEARSVAEKVSDLDWKGWAFDMIQIEKDKALQPPRALYVWKSSDFFSDQERLFGLCEKGGVGYLFVSSYGLNEEGHLYRKLVEDAHSRGIKVHTFSAGRWLRCTEEDSKRASEFVDDVLVYNLRAKPEERFDGIHLDVGPWKLNDIQRFREPHSEKINFKEIFPDYFALIGKCKTRIDQSGQDVQFGIDIPFWLHKLMFELNGQSKPMAQHLLDAVDYAVLTTYRKEPKEIGRLAEPGIDYAASTGKNVFVGIARNIWNSDASMIRESLSPVERTYRGKEGFAGIAIQGYRNFLDVMPDREV